MKIDTKSICANGFHYHPNCFRCCKCKIQLPIQYYTQNDMVFCLECSDSIEFLRCESCQNYLEGEYVTFADKNYHFNCFQCELCRYINLSPNFLFFFSKIISNLRKSCADAKFYIVKNKIVCEVCINVK